MEKWKSLTNKKKIKKINDIINSGSRPILAIKYKEKGEVIMETKMPEWFAAWSKNLDIRLDGIDARLDGIDTRIDDLKEYVDERFNNLIVKNNLKT